MEKREKLFEMMDRRKMPGHVAIIMDGNGRWATGRGLPRFLGHSKGVEIVREITKFTSKYLQEVKVLTLYVFSTENWSRPKAEVQSLMELIKKNVEYNMPLFRENNVRLSWVGRRSGIKDDVKESLDNAVKELKKNSGLILNLAINYGGRAEIVDACKAVSKEVSEKTLSLYDVDEKKFESFLYANELPELDLMIRTGGDLRVSNFLLWQLAYAELWVTPVFWPDFKPEHLMQAIIDYQKRQRKFGALDQ